MHQVVMQPVSSELKKNQGDASGGDAANELTVEKKSKRCIKW
jgi:hypothetical protein